MFGLTRTGLRPVEIPQGVTDSKSVRQGKTKSLW